MSTVLWKFGFAGHIISVILTFFTHPSDKSWTSGFISSSFPIANGTWDREVPLYPIIFSLIIEPLVEHIHPIPLISGGLYADDVLLSLTNPVSQG